MPAHANVRPRTVGLTASSGSSSAPAANNNGASRPTRPRASTLAGEKAIIDYLDKSTSESGYVCLTLKDLADHVGLTKESLRLRVDQMRADGRVRREPCWCSAYDTPHVRFFRPGTNPGDIVITEAPAPAAAPVAETTAPRYEVRQIIAAQPDTFALFRVEGTVWRDPVVAWGVWDEWRAGQRHAAAGPLVFGSTGLEPAIATPGFAGVRIGGFRCLDDDRSFDDADLAVEPA